MGLGARLIDLISGVFQPFLGALCAAGIIKGLLRCGLLSQVSQELMLPQAEHISSGIPLETDSSISCRLS